MKPKFPQPPAPDNRLNDCGKIPQPAGSATAVTNNTLVTRARQGDLAAFEELFKLYHKKIYSIAYQILGDETEASDVTQDVFIKAYASIGSLKSDAAFVTWLKTAAVNKCRDLIRKRKRVKTESLDSPVTLDDGSSTTREIADSSDGPEDALVSRDLRDSVRKAINSLQPDYREVVTLFYIDGADISEIARVTGAREGTIKSRLSRARAQLKRKLEGYVNNAQ